MEEAAIPANGKKFQKLSDLRVWQLYVSEMFKKGTVEVVVENNVCGYSSTGKADTELGTTEFEVDKLRYTETKKWSHETVIDVNGTYTR